MATRNVTLQKIADLISQGQNNAKERLDDLKDDLNAKHKENVDRRHEIVDKYSELEGRVTVLERDMRTVVGDNTGGSGLLHNIDKKVDALQSEVASIRQTVQDTPKINRWIYAAMGVIGLLLVVVPIIITIVFEVLKLVTKH